MFEGWLVLLVALSYLSLLFAIAYYGDKRADRGRSLIGNPYIYSLSIAVYCTSWTFYGSVGRAASSGIEFLAIYIGPTLTFALWWVVLCKILRISKANRITSIADFISSRYGKSTLLGGLVTVIAVVGIMPYISLQLKAISISFRLLISHPAAASPVAAPPVLGDTALLVALALAAFAILFGTRQIDASEHHEGMVAAIAFESIVKLVAFLAVGIFVTFWLNDGFADLFDKAAATEKIAQLFHPQGREAYGRWFTLILLSMAAIICLPRQFQVTIVENVNEDHLRKAVWLFPLYLLAINIFVLPIAFAGLMQFPNGTVDADTFVLTLPMSQGAELLTLLVFIGGLSAATAMVIVATVALSTMVCNDLVMPVLLRWRRLKLRERTDLSRWLLNIRRGSIIAIVLLGYSYFRLIGTSYALVTIGLVSFAAAAQFLPSIIGGIFWKGGRRNGALAGLSFGFAIWAYTLLLPSFALSGWLPTDFVEVGPFGLAFLNPYGLFGLEWSDHISHALFWSMFGNIGAYVIVSMWGQQSAIERIQAALFVDAFRHVGKQGGSQFWRGTATVSELHDLLARFLGDARADRALDDYAMSRNLDLGKLAEADAHLVNFTEQLLAGAIGAASARVMVASVAKGENVSIDEVMKILDETSQVIEHSHQLEEKSRQLEVATSELRAANERLQELDRLKDDFLSTVSHELRTPLTSIRSSTEILYDNPDLDPERQREFLGVTIKELERLTRLINQILDLAKMEADSTEWQMADVDPRPAIEDALAATSGLFEERGIALQADLSDSMPTIFADRDRLIQVVVNLLSNAVNYCPAYVGVVRVEARIRQRSLLVSVSDNGPGVPRKARKMIFEKFQRAGDTNDDVPHGTGLGLPICRRIIEHFRGRIWVESAPKRGASFKFSIPLGRQPGAAE